MSILHDLMRARLYWLLLAIWLWSWRGGGLSRYIWSSSFLRAILRSFYCRLTRKQTFLWLLRLMLSSRLSTSFFWWSSLSSTSYWSPVLLTLPTTHYSGQVTIFPIPSSIKPPVTLVTTVGPSAHFYLFLLSFRLLSARQVFIPCWPFQQAQPK